MILNFYKSKLSLVVLMTSLVFCDRAAAKTHEAKTDQKNTSDQKISFTENKGQIHDQFDKSRPDVLFGGTDGNLVFHLRRNGISYQLSKVDSWKERETLQGIASKIHGAPKIPAQISTYRLDINWLNANKNASIIKSGAFAGQSNYYFTNCPGGVFGVQSYETITYQNIYEGVDLKWYEKDGRLKYDYLVAAGADYTQIELSIEGADKISVNGKGEVVFKTFMGDIIEQAPLVTQQGKVLRSAWKLIGDHLTFEIQGVDPKKSMIIDPAIRVWGTYYGGSGSDDANVCVTDAFNNVFIAGETSSNSGTVIATSGTHQTTLIGGMNAYVAKFDATGIRQWATYYGGGTEYGTGCSPDTLGNVYLSGVTSESTGIVIASTGAHQPNYGGGPTDGFLAKFNASGIRVWGTYYGGFFSVNGSVDYATSCATDLSGNVYLAGYTDSNQGTVIATVGSHQPSFGNNVDAFLVKFNTNGVRQWGTYYGAEGVEYGYCATDAVGNVYLAGHASSTVAIATSGSHQQTLGGIGINYFSDAFLAKFDASGVRQWGTYYGGVESDEANFCAVDRQGNIFIAGNTQSNTLSDTIATTGSHQKIYGGGSYDAFVAKFNASGVRQWGTYYGGNEADYGYSCATDHAGNVYLGGSTSSTLISAIATSGSYQYAIPAGAFLAKFDNAGTRQWGTYYGGSLLDFSFGASCTADSLGNVYLAGVTNNASGGTAVATSTSHQPASGGSGDAFLVKFNDCQAAGTPSAISGPSNTCPGTVHYSVSPVPNAVSYSWTLPSGWLGSSATNTISAITGASGTLSVSATGTCGASAAKTLSVSVHICTGLDGTVNQDPQLIIYPNPSRGSFQLNLENLDDVANVKVYNVVGALINSEITGNRILKVEMQDVPEGIYFIKINSNTREYIKKFVVIK